MRQVRRLRQPRLDAASGSGTLAVSGREFFVEQVEGLREQHDDMVRTVIADFRGEEEPLGELPTRGVAGDGRENIL